jgi:RNA polymerase sigma-70 factor (ECF subfamily)
MTADRSKGLNVGVPPRAVALEQYTPRLHQYLRRLLRDPRSIPDVVQETFRRFIARADRPEFLRDPLAFLLGMARNVARELAYEERRQIVRFDSAIAEDRAEGLDLADTRDAAEALAIQDDLVRALGRLPDAHLAVLLLVDSEGRSYEEAAQLTGFTRSTVATYLTQARARLRTLLEDERPSQDRNT